MTKLMEVSEQELENIIRTSSKPVVVFVYTPFCGTCKVSGRMFDVALELSPNLTALSCNLNTAPNLATQWQITSVPCLLAFDAGQVIARLYAFRSVERVIDFLRDDAQPSTSC